MGAKLQLNLYYGKKPDNSSRSRVWIQSSSVVLSAWIESIDLEDGIVTLNW